MSVRAVDLFCGAGGSSWGARNAGVEIIAGIDRWDLAAESFEANFPEAHCITRDIRRVRPADLLGRTGQVDLLLASPECTSHGPARGGRERCDLSRETALQVPRIAAALQPRWIVIENVAAMRSWRRYPELLRRLRALGFHISEHRLDAAEFGVPQSRRRLYVLGDRERPPRFEHPRRRVMRVAADVVDLDGTYRWSPLNTPRRAPPTLERAARAVASVGPWEPFLIVYYGTDRAGGWQRLDSPLRTITTVDRFAVVKRTRSGHLMRMLQVPELKAAMGMPRRFKIINGTRRQRIMQVGNGVCPPVMEHLVRRLIR